MSHGAVYGDWLCDVIDRLDLREVVVVGHSLGAVVALAGAARGAPFAGIVLYNPAGLVRLRVTARVLAATLPWLARPSSFTAERLVRTMTTKAVPDHLVAWMVQVGRHVRTSLTPVTSCPTSNHFTSSEPYGHPSALASEVERNTLNFGKR